jgi:Zn-dependent protease with chaperone function
MSEMTATRTGRPHSFALAVVLLAVAVVWGVAIALLWRTEIPSSLELPHLDPRDFFTQAQLDRAADYERFYFMLWPFSVLASLGTLVVLAQRAPGWARVIGLGRVGTGVVIGMLTLTALWFAGLPFDIAGRWWREHHGLTHGSWFEWLTDPWLQLLGEAVTAFVLIVILLALAGRFPRHWWIAATPILFAIAVGLSIGYGGLVGLDSHPIRNPELRREARALGRQLDAGSTPVEVQEVKDLTKQVNAMAIGLGPTQRIVLWDTLLDGNFGNGEVRFVLAHEFGHIVRHHLWKGLAWFVLFSAPALALLAWITGRRGGLRDPALLPYGILVLMLIQLAAAPLQNVVSRRYESEADWVALQATRDPAAGRGLFREFATTNLSTPDPPTWTYVMFDTHPTLMQRIAMTEAWEARRR